MIKQLVTISSFVAGGAGLVFIGYLQTHPMAFTRPVATDVATAETVPLPLGNSLVNAEPIAFANDVITVKPPRAAHAARRLESAKPLEPCTDWRSVGASYVTEGRAIGSHLVRQLCEP